MILHSVEELQRDLQSHGLGSVYLVLSVEAYQSRQAVELFKKAALTAESAAFDFLEFNARGASVDQIVDSVNTFPMLSPRRVVLLSETERLNDSQQEQLLSALPSLSRRGLLILLGEDLDHRRKFYKTLLADHCVAEFAKLKGAALERWAESFVRGEGYRISSAALKKIVALAGSDQQSLAAELEKVLLYSGKEKTVPDQAVEDLVRESRQSGIFDLIGALARRDRGGCLRFLANLMALGESPLMVVAMMARHCRQVLISREQLRAGASPQQIASAAQIPPFMLEQFLRQAGEADIQTIRAMMIGLADVDRRLKSSAGDGRMLLEKLICALV